MGHASARSGSQCRGKPQGRLHPRALGLLHGRRWNLLPRFRACHLLLQRRLLPNHGAITLGDSVHEAFYLTHQLVEACKVQLLTLSCARSPSDFKVVDDQTVEETYRIVQDNYTGNEFGKLEWEAAKRKMETEQGVGYKE